MIKKITEKKIRRDLKKAVTECSDQLLYLSGLSDNEISLLGGEEKFKEICKRYADIVCVINTIIYDIDYNWD